MKDKDGDLTSGMETLPVALPTGLTDPAVERLVRSLVENQAGLRRAQEMTQLSHVVVDAGGRIQSFSDSFCRLLALELESLPRTTTEWLALVHPDDRQRVSERAEAARRDVVRMEIEYRIAGSGGWVHVRHVQEPLADVPAPAEGLRTFNTLQDMTHQEQAESRLRQLNRLFAVLSGINNLIVRATDRDELFSQACRLIVRTGGFTKSWIGLTGEGVKPVRLLGWAGAEDAFFIDLQRRLSSRDYDGLGAIGRALASGEPVISNDVANDPKVVERTKLVAAGSLALALLPLSIDGQVIGVLSIHSPIPGFFDDEELRLLRELAGDISFAVDHLGKANKISYLANHDPLTGLTNRQLFSELLTHQLADAGRGSEVAVVLVDLERFGRINETLGQQGGDELLRSVACRLKAVDGQAARIGPNLFALRIVRGRSATQLAHAFEQLVEQCFADPFVVAGHELRVGCRIGAAVYPGDAADAETLLRNAEAALRQAKKSMQPFVFYAPEMNARAAEALALESRLRRAIEQQEFVLHYQPKIRLAGRRICGLEALIRWQDPDRGLVPPMRFIPVLEESGLIAAVGRWAVGQALADRQAWIDAGLPAVRVAVNVSPLQLNQDDFAAQIDLPGSAEGLELEITESVIMDDVDRKIGMLTRIRDRGVTIAIDDFGTGYSSLAYIARLPINALKIDRAFINEMTGGPEGYSMVSSIIAMAHALQLKVVAEGVETEEQARLLVLLACDEAQGYLFSKPLPAADIPVLLAAGSLPLARPPPVTTG